jgi:hypothetical protein
MTLFRALVLCGIGTVAACAAAPPLGQTPPMQTRAELVGPLCSGLVCHCRDRGLAGAPEEGKKRYHLKLGPAAQSLWLSLGKTILYKDAQQGESCFVVDLTPGKQPVRFRAHGDGGVAAAFAIEELGFDPKSGEERWYDTVHFRCGSPALCDREMLHSEGERLRSLGNLHDPCGSTRVAGVKWQTGRASDGGHFDDVEVDFELDVYRFAPSKPPCPSGAPQ